MGRRHITTTGKVLLPILLVLIVAVFLAPRPWNAVAMLVAVLLALAILFARPEADRIGRMR